MATLQNLGVLKYRDKNGNWKPLPVVLQSSGGGGSGGISTISGKGQPTESTVGRLNQLYRDESTDKLYICTGDDGGYTWAAVVSDTENAVTYTTQTLTEEQKTQARANIGAGTSNFSGSYNDLTNKPNIPAASVIDTTLSKSGQAADAKAAGDAIKKKLDKAQGVENAGRILGVDEDGNVVPEDKPVQALAGAAAPTAATAGVVGQEYYVIEDNAVTEMYVCTSALIGSYTWDKVEFGGGASNAVQYTEQSLTDTQKQQARTNIGAGTSSFSGSYNDLTNTPIPDTTLKQSGKPADAKAVGEALDEVTDIVTTFGSIKVDKSQGTANAGKYLGVGNDGNVTVVDAPSGGADKSLGITSATVGQIAKITAVDASGKPTAWEAVDETNRTEWKKICDIVIGEDDDNVNALLTSTMPDGTSLSELNIKEIIFAGFTQIEEASSYQFCSFFVNDKSIIIGQNFNTAVGNKTFFRGRFALIGDGYATAEWSTGAAATIAIAGGGIIVAPHYYGANTSEIEDRYNFTKITSIKLTGPKSTSGVENDIKLARLLVYGR